MVTAEDATILLPGSDVILSVADDELLMSWTMAPHSEIGMEDSSFRYGTPKPPPTQSSGSPKCSARLTRISVDLRKESLVKIWDPIWAWRPIRSIAPEDLALSMALPACPF